MNKIVFCVVILSALAFINAKPEGEKKDSSSEEDNRPLSVKFRELATKVHDRYNTTLLLDMAHQHDKVRERCPDLKEKMEKVVEEVATCFEEKEKDSSDDETMCAFMIKNWSPCLKPARDAVAGCLPEASRELPTLVDKVLVAVLEQTCHSTVEEVVELMNPCAWQASHDYPVCKELKTRLNEHKGELPTTANVCDMLPKMRECGTLVMKNSCKGKVTTRMWKKYDDAVVNAVKGTCDALNKA